MVDAWPEPTYEEKMRVPPPPPPPPLGANPFPQGRYFAQKCEIGFVQIGNTNWHFRAPRGLGTVSPRFPTLDKTIGIPSQTLRRHFFCFSSGSKGVCFFYILSPNFAPFND